MTSCLQNGIDCSTLKQISLGNNLVIFCPNWICNFVSVDIR